MKKKINKFQFTCLHFYYQLMTFNYIFLNTTPFIQSTINRDMPYLIVPKSVPHTIASHRSLTNHIKLYLTIAGMLFSLIVLEVFSKRALLSPYFNSFQYNLGCRNRELRKFGKNFVIHSHFFFLIFFSGF